MNPETHTPMNPLPTDPFTPVPVPDLVARLRNFPWLTTAAANAIDRLQSENSVQCRVIQTLERQYEAMRLQRDEARRQACASEARLNGFMFDHPRHSDPAALAAERGWDCFKENTDD